ncbi:MAG: DUF362 domain-containing protein [Methanolinea sp.]|nr:DUF362 domain-containing protein [Methanolinea sp.]
MPEKVYFARAGGRDPGQNTVSKVRRLFHAAGFQSLVSPGDLTAVKIHFGEVGNDSFISPVHARVVVDCVREAGGKPFLTDSNTLYLGGRANAADHLVTAIEHGFAFAVVKAPVTIADGLRGKNYRKVEVHLRHFSTVLVSGDIADADAMVVLSHFKGHEVAGFGGAIKNLAMGCAPPAGKQAQHCARPLHVAERCTGCGKCAAACPREAIHIERPRGGAVARFHHTRCIGCFECMTVCPARAIDVDWETEIPEFVERMVEYARGAVKGKEGKTGYMNFLLDVTPDCDCVPWSDTPIVPDIGILASRDPVAIDAASFDLVNRERGREGSFLRENLGQGEDKFRGMRRNTEGYRQITYGEEVGLGSRDYELVVLS